MVTKGTVQGRVESNKYSVILEKYGDISALIKEWENAGKTDFGLLNQTNVAVVATAPGLEWVLPNNTVVYVCIHDNNLEAPVIVGIASMPSNNSACGVNASLLSLVVSGATSLGKETSIGDVKKEELGRISGLSENAQVQFNTIRDNLTEMFSSVIDDIRTYLPEDMLPII